MKWIGQHIWDFIARFKNDVYLESISSDTPDANSYLALKGGKVVKTSGGTGGTISVQEVDGSPSNGTVATIKVSNGTLTDNGDGSVTIDTGGSGNGLTVDDLSDADTSGVAANDILVWNGSNFVVESMTDLIANPLLYTFSLTSFVDDISGLQLIGTGYWKAIDAITFTAEYVAGPPSTSAVIEFYDSSNPSAGWQSLNSMDSPALTSGNNSTVINYPSSKDKYIRFKLTVVNDGVTSVNYANPWYFRNRIFYGASNSGSLNETGVEALSSVVSGSYTSDRSVNAASGKYVYYAYPSTYTDIHDNGFKFNGITTPFEDKDIVSITNSNGYQENYNVYRSTNHSLGNHTLEVSVSETLVNHIFCGLTDQTSGLNVDDFTSISETLATNDNTKTWNEVTAGSGKYIMFAWPSRLATPTFSVGGFAGGFDTVETANYTNINGFTEEYRFFRSNNSNLGDVTVVTS